MSLDMLMSFGIGISPGLWLVACGLWLVGGYTSLSVLVTTATPRVWTSVSVTFEESVREAASLTWPRGSHAGSRARRMIGSRSTSSSVHACASPLLMAAVVTARRRAYFFSGG